MVDPVDPVPRADYDHAHPSAGTPLSGHWAARVTVIHPAAAVVHPYLGHMADHRRCDPCRSANARAPGEVVMPRRGGRRDRSAAGDVPRPGMAAVLVGYLILLCCSSATIAAGCLAL